MGFAYLPWVFSGSDQSQDEYSVVPDERVWQCKWGEFQGGDYWKRIPRYLLLLLFLSVVPAALKVIEDEVRSPKAVNLPRLVGGEGRALGQAQSQP